MPVESAEDLAAFFDPEEFGTWARFIPGDGSSPKTISVICDCPTVDLPFGDTIIPTGSNLFRLQVAGVMKPMARDRLERFDPVTLDVFARFEIVGEPRLDSFGTLWVCEVLPIDF